MNILLCEDNEDDRFFFKLAIKKINRTIALETVNDGEELMNYLETAQTLPDILFLDLNMPRKNGFVCLEEVKNDNKYREMAVTIFTTTNEPDAIEKTFESGADLYAVKPPDFKSLPALIQKVIDRISLNSNGKHSMKSFVVRDNS